ncbi:hypothetical protein GCM10011584_20290 [Nocardioides phosphati]|uniref:Secreted protein n=1 Tax=Nocardioides phosphati TaxID=1867775 RepID=A0ABQ2N9T8_9ACTN|nr:hypothetical protein [Nocardioides phosphati]GGO89851.1 hypothetical protein GCM10011584_20290 [Nocardioides phosphati]
MHVPFIRPLAGGFVAAIALTVLGATSAQAGEITGTGDSLKLPDGSLHGASICAFSGLNDAYSGDPSVPDEDGFTRTQNWGQISKDGKEFLTSVGFNPGKSCKPGFEE